MPGDDEFQRFKAELLDSFDSEVEVTGEATPTISGSFEVSVNGAIVHSKKNGDGFVDSKDKMDKIEEAVKKCL